MLFANENPNLGSGTQINGQLAIRDISLRVELTATDVSRSVWICPTGDAYQFVGVDEVHATASSSGTLQIEKLTGTTAPGSGTVLLTGTVSLAGTANTVTSGTALAGNTTSLALAAGDRLGIKIAGTMTSIVGGVAVIKLKRILP